MATLQPLYKPIENKDVDDFELQDMEANSTTKEEKKVNGCEDNNKCQKARRARACCTCMAVSHCVVLLATTFVLAIVLGVAAYRVKHCVYPSIHNINTYSFKPEDLDSLSFDIPTGSITVHTCSKAKNVTVKLTTGAKKSDLLEQTKVATVESPRSFGIVVQTPSFNLQSCHIVHVEVVIPESSKYPLSLIASAEVGLVQFKSNSYTFKNVEAKVNVGFVKARHLRAQTISATASLGGVMGRDWTANQSSVHIDVGGACLKSISSGHSTFEIQKGYLKTCDMDSQTMNVKVDYGFSCLKEVNAKSLVSEIGYGRMSVQPSTSFAGTIVFSTQRGSFDITGSRGVVVPPAITFQQQLPKQAPQQMQQIQISGTEKISETSKFELKTSSGHVDLHLRRS